MTSITITVALIRLGFLVLWGFFCLFERRERVMIWTLAAALAVGNIFAIGTAYFMEHPGG